MPERTPRILNVNDDSASRYVVTRMLQRAGFEVIEAVTGAEALAAIAQVPDLVILDVKLPDMSGFDVCRRLKADPETAALPVLHVSASFVKSENKVQGLEGGADGYLAQPVEAAELVATVRALLRVREAEAEARRLSRRWQTTFDALSDAVCLLDGRGAVVQGNTAFRSLFACGETLEGCAFVELIRRLGGEGPEGVLALDACGVSEARLGDRWFRVSADPVTDEQGRITGAVRVLADITERRRLEEELRARADELAAADRRKDEFLAMLAHELRNPLAAITTGLQVLDRLTMEEERAARMREVVRRQAHHLGRLVDDLLDVSRITQGKIELRRQRIDLSAAVRQAIQVVNPLVEERRHTLEVSLPDEPVWIEADNTRVEQVVANLLDNAVKYTEPGGRLSVAVSCQGSWATVRVRDTGIGIPVEMLGRVFEPFAQGEQSLARSRGGLGIGLTLVRQLVEMHGGAVLATSEGVGKGSEFMVRLPAAPHPPELAPLPTPTSIGPVVPSVRRRVLVVEDNPDARDALQDLLCEWGHQVDVATDGPSGVEKALLLRPDVALVDIGLPGMDGYQVARRVRSTAEGARLFLVALTGYGGVQQRRQAIEAGFDLHLVKPVDADELARVVDELPRENGRGEVEPTGRAATS